MISLVAKGDKDMGKTSFARWFAILLAASGILCWARSSTGSAAAAGTGQNAMAPDPRLDMVRTLQAMGPDPSLGNQAKVFGRFVGTWDVEYNFLTKDGKPAGRSNGEVIVGWVMDGHALQDLFIAGPMSPGGERMMGTTLRYFDSKSGKWRITYIDPEHDYIRTLTGGAIGDDRIVLYGQDPDGTELRWSFNDIQADSFVWRGEKSSDGGKTWWMDEEHHFKQRTTTSNATTDDPRLEMVRTLQAVGPHPSLVDQANVFGRFVGTWDVDYGEISEDGKITHYPGELVVGWVMDGHALQDLFITDPTSPGGQRTMGTTLRYFDNKSGKWHVTYIEPPMNGVVQLTGGQEGDRVVLYGDGRKGSKLRWSFNDIKDNSFTWRGERSRDGGKTWKLVEEHHMKRHATTSVTP